MSKIRRAAKGQPCMLCLDVCNHDPETTVLAHVPIPGNSGMGMKPPDVSGIFACSDCHSVLDGRTNQPRPVPQYVLEGMLRTHERLRQMGLVE